MRTNLLWQEIPLQKQSTQSSPQSIHLKKTSAFSTAQFSPAHPKTRPITVATSVSLPTPRLIAPPPAQESLLAWLSTTPKAKLPKGSTSPLKASWEPPARLAVASSTRHE